MRNKIDVIILVSLAAIATGLGFITFSQGQKIEEIQSRIEKLEPPPAQEKAPKIVCQIADNSLPELKSTPSNSKDNYLSITLKEAIEVARKNNKELRAANESDKNRLSEELSFRVVRDYHNLQQADAQIKIAEEMVKNATQTEKDAQLLEQAGLGTKFDVLKATVAVDDARQSLNSSVANQQLARLQLAESLNLRQPKEPRATDKIEKAGSWNLPLAESVALAYKNAEEKQRNININSTESDNPCSQIRLEVATAYFSQIANQKNLELSSKTVEVAKETLRHARLRFQAGVGTQTDVIEAQNALTLAQDNRLRVITDYNQSLNTLQWAVGRQLQNP
jgi:outer membrane protein TolC